MNSFDTLLLSKQDYYRLAELLSARQSESFDQLLQELDRAQIVDDHAVPSSVVKMNSSLIYKFLDTGKEMEVTLVYPENANINDNKVSVLAPLGSALIGLSEGQEIEWTMPNEKVRKIRVVRVFQTQDLRHEKQS